MGIKNEIENKSDDFKKLCIENKVKSLYAFGSSITSGYDPDSSDIDLLVEIDEPDPLERGEKLINLWDKFETFFNKKIDLLTESSIRNPILKENIERTKILIYDGTGQKILV